MTIEEISDGLVKLIVDAELGAATVRALSSSDIEEQSGVLLTLPPALLVMFDGSLLESSDLPGRTYAWTSRWRVIVVAEDLSGGAEPARGAYRLLDELMKIAAGADVVGAEGKARLFLESQQIEDAEPGRVAYSMTVRAETHFQKA